MLVKNQPSHKRTNTAELPHLDMRSLGVSDSKWKGAVAAGGERHGMPVSNEDIPGMDGDNGGTARWVFLM